MSERLNALSEGVDAGDGEGERKLVGEERFGKISDVEDFLEVEKKKFLINLISSKGLDGSLRSSFP